MKLTKKTFDMFLDPYNVAVRYLREKYPQALNISMLNNIKDIEIPHEDLELSLLVGQYRFGISVHADLVNCLYKINLTNPKNLLIFEDTK